MARRGRRTDAPDIEGMRAVLMAAPISISSWALNELSEGRACLTLDHGDWVAGFFEKGRFDERFRESDPRIALPKFIEWVKAAEQSTRASSEATERWHRRTGQRRP